LKRDIIVGTRESALAVWQTNWIVNQLKNHHPGLTIKIIHIKTKGDKILDTALAKIGDKGLFTKELETALLEKKIDLAVHSMKDLPSKLTPGLLIGAICERESPGDVLISRSGQNLEQLPEGAVLGTSSLRRSAQLLKYRPDFRLESLRGNLNTRMEKLNTEKFDGIVLAAAGVIRMGWTDRITQYIPYEISLPAVGQGSIGVEIRDHDPEILKLIQKLNDPASQAAITAERALMFKLEGGCQVPIGALGRVEGDTLHLEATVVSLDGTQSVRFKTSGPVQQAEQLGLELAEQLLKNGASQILEQVRKENR
jgi:hydroxymethylbilane synthase